MPMPEPNLRPPYLVLALSAVLVAAVAFGALNFGDETTSSVASETRTLTGEANGIELAGPIDAVIRVGAAQTVSIEGDDALRPQVTTELRDGVLHIGFPSGTPWKNAHLRARITLPALQTMRIAGSGDASISGLAGGPLAITIDGSGNVNAAGRVDRLDVAVHSSGDLESGSLAVRDATLRVDGSGDVNLGDVQGGTVQVEIRGSGDVTIRGRAERLDARVDASGDLDASALDVQDARVELRSSGDAEVRAERTLETLELGDGSLTQHGAAPVTSASRR
jgi:Putative auto-transporter adhesin, head GIN domain